MSNVEPISPPALGKLDRKLLIDDASMGELLRIIVAKGASARFKARGFSMHPFIKDGDVIVVSPIVDNSLGQGDIVAFLHPEGGKLCVHRIVRANADGFLIRGDNLPFADGDILRENIIGMVSCVERNGRKVFFGNGPERKMIARFWHLPAARYLRYLAERALELKRVVALL